MPSLSILLKSCQNQYYKSIWLSMHAINKQNELLCKYSKLIPMKFSLLLNIMVSFRVAVYGWNMTQHRSPIKLSINILLLFSWQLSFLLLCSSLCRALMAPHEMAVVFRGQVIQRKEISLKRTDTWQLF